ncbi:MAG: hypothetical protein IPM01_26130 [Burkholderiaceae bacterium]|nr:hypothetical protein [Burkholderiaceae bacterium]
MTPLAHRDARTLFERAWSHGIRTGLITAQRREALLVEGTRAIRKIADILGTEHLRGDLERALRSMLGLMNIHLERVSGGDVEQAARSLVENGLLFHTRGASRAIKRVLASVDQRDPDALDPEAQRHYETIVVTEWPGRSLAYLLARERGAREELALRQAAQALVRGLGGPSGLNESEPVPVIMTALLVHAYQPRPTWPRDVRSFEALLAAVRKSPARLGRFPQGILPAHREVVEPVWTANAALVRANVVDSLLPLHVLAAGGPDVNPLHGHLELPDDALEEVDGHAVATTTHWEKLTRGTSDEARLVLILLQGVVGIADKPPFSLKAVAGLLKTALREKPANRLFQDWLTANVPHRLQPDMTELWEAFWEEREALSSEDPASDDFKHFARTWFPMRAPRSAEK